VCKPKVKYNSSSQRKWFAYSSSTPRFTLVNLKVGLRLCTLLLLFLFCVCVCRKQMQQKNKFVLAQARSIPCLFVSATTFAQLNSMLVLTYNRFIKLNWRANVIRYLNSPDYKQWILNTMYINPCSIVVNMLSIPHWIRTFAKKKGNMTHQHV
jgi:hypothetical protein